MHSFGLNTWPNCCQPHWNTPIQVSQHNPNVFIPFFASRRAIFSCVNVEAFRFWNVSFSMEGKKSRFKRLGFDGMTTKKTIGTHILQLQTTHSHHHKSIAGSVCICVGNDWNECSPLNGAKDERIPFGCQQKVRLKFRFDCHFGAEFQVGCIHQTHLKRASHVISVYIIRHTHTHKPIRRLGFRVSCISISISQFFNRRRFIAFIFFNLLSFVWFKPLNALASRYCSFSNILKIISESWKWF